MHADGPRPKPFKDSSFNPLWIVGLGLVALSLWQLYERSKGRPTPPEPRPAATQRVTPPPDVAPLRSQPPLTQPLRPAYREPEPPPREGPPERTTIYLCKSYGGGMFWSTALCSVQRATIDRIAIVPGGLPFEQQVTIAEGERTEAAKLYAPPPAPTVTRRNHQTVDKSAECQALEESIRQLDARARQPQTGYTQDWIRNERMKARSRQAALRC